MKVLFAASECVPFVKTGGLADVVGALPPVLQKQGVEVRVFLPKYGQIAEEYKRQMQPVAQFEIDLCWRKQYCGIESLEYGGVTWYFVDNLYYYNRPYVYGMGGDEYERFGFFCRAVLNALPLVGFAPDIIHCHDWQTGMIPALLKIQYAHLPFYQNIKTIQTIHNLQYQGIFGIREVQDCLGLGDSLFTSDKLEAYGMANYLKAGIIYADEITTVSPSYAEEITTVYYGERLDGLLRARRASLSGIVNGIDTEEYDPSADPLIAGRYSVDDLGGKRDCKAALQRELGLNESENTPLIGMVTRLSNQKGLDLVDHVITQIMEWDVQLAVLGKGDQKYTDLFAWAESAYPGRVATRFEMNHALAHRIYAGADLFLMPSLFEPCGLSQMIALRYGTLPVTRETGGLRDTVIAYNEYTGDGNGFTFFNYNAHDMLHTIGRALSYYQERPELWRGLMLRGMAGDYSWRHSAAEYAALYQRLLAPREAETGTAKTARKTSKKLEPQQTEANVAIEMSKIPKKKEAAPRKPRAKAAPKENAAEEKAPATPKGNAAEKVLASSKENVVEAKVPAVPKETSEGSVAGAKAPAAKSAGVSTGAKLEKEEKISNEDKTAGKRRRKNGATSGEKT